METAENHAMTGPTHKPLWASHSGLVAVPNINFQKPKMDTVQDNQRPLDESNSASRSTTRPATNGPPKIDLQPEPVMSPADNRQDYNVYASAFVPTQLRQVNKLDGTVVHSKPRHWIDYTKYIGTFVGSTFLRDRPAMPRLLSNDQNLQAAQAAGLSEKSYLSRLYALWQSENRAKQLEDDRFSLFIVPLQRVIRVDGKDLFALSIPGLREDSPFVEMGDTIQLRQLCADVYGNLPGISQQSPIFNSHIPSPSHSLWTGIIYDASVYLVHRAEETVYLRVDGLQESFHSTYSRPLFVNVIFRPKKRLVDAHHVALGLISHALQNFHNDWVRRMLFPTETDGIQQTELRKVPHRKLFDPQVNYEQAHAVNSVCLGDYGVLPYLISGPPGTGKTKTVVEIAMQLLTSHKADHILICAPSEQAADTLTLRLKPYLGPQILLRLNGPWRADNEVPLGLSQYTHMEDNMYYIPPFKKLMAYNVVVTSCRDAAILMNARVTNIDLWHFETDFYSSLHGVHPRTLPKLHWDALIIDEAAQATEMDVLPAMSVVCPPSDYPPDMPQPRFVMVGDEKQLGPRTASRDPRFSTSLMARLFERPLYRDHPLSRSRMKASSTPPVLTKVMLPMPYAPFTSLIRNYRSHPAILSIPSSLFYNDTLIPEVPVPNTWLQKSRLWQGRKWPVLFVPRQYHDEIERDGGGWYNLQESKEACDIAQELVLYAGVTQSDICIMSPFAAQVKRLRHLIRSSAYGGGGGLREVNIGPLEAFQGLESRVVILCTTRSRGRFLEEDVRKGLGVIHQPRKLNVALTRAKEALIVIGNPTVLAEDEHWREWMGFCWRNGLFWDQNGVWGNEISQEVSAVVSTGERKGVLEKALLAKEEIGNQGRVLGAGRASLEDATDGEYEAWLEGLRRATEEDMNGGEREGEEEVDEAEQVEREIEEQDCEEEEADTQDENDLEQEMVRLVDGL